MDEKTMRKIEDRVAETKAKSFCPPTDERVVKAWDAWDKRVVDVYDQDADVEIERGSRQVLGIGVAGDIIRGIELRMGSASPAEELDAWMKVSDFMGDVFPSFSNPDADKALLLVNEWNNLMDAITHDYEEASPDVRQAAEDQKIVALGCLNEWSEIGMEIYDDSVDLETISSLRKPNGYLVNTFVTLYYTTPTRVYIAVYPGWDGPDEIIRHGGWVDGVYIQPYEVNADDLFSRLSDPVRDELEPLAGGDPAEWNGKIRELEMSGDVSHRDKKLLHALWIEGETFGGSVTVYGAGAHDVLWMNEDDFKSLGLHRVDSDEDDEDEDAVDYDEDAMDFGL